MDVPHRADVGRLVLAEQRAEAAHLVTVGAAQAEAGRHAGEIAAAVHGPGRIDACWRGTCGTPRRSRRRSSTAISIWMPWRRIVSSSWMCISRLPSPSISMHLAVAARRGDADCRRQARADGAEIVDDVILVGRPAPHVGHGDAEVVPAADHDVPVLGDRLVELDASPCADRRCWAAPGIPWQSGESPGDLLGHVRRCGSPCA